MPAGTLLEPHSMDMLVNVDGVFSGHHLIDGGTALLPLVTILCRSHSTRPQNFILFTKTVGMGCSLLLLFFILLLL